MNFDKLLDAIKTVGFPIMVAVILLAHLLVNMNIDLENQHILNQILIADRDIANCLRDSHRPALAHRPPYVQVKL